MSVKPKWFFVKICIMFLTFLSGERIICKPTHLYIITPTYKRPEQIAELTRLSHTLKLVRNVTWLVIEDSRKENPLVKKLLLKSKIDYVYLLAPMPDAFKTLPYNRKPRGVSNRNRGIKWIREHAKNGVVYFADDDNTYDLELFCELRKTKKLSLFPVGLLTKLHLSTPVVKNCSLIGWYDGWLANRIFPVDFAGFAVSVKFLLSRPNASIPFRTGYEEDKFLQSLFPFGLEDIELLASCCTKILVWHTKTVKNVRFVPIPEIYEETNLWNLRKYFF